MDRSHLLLLSSLQHVFIDMRALPPPPLYEYCLRCCCLFLFSLIAFFLYTLDHSFSIQIALVLSCASSLPLLVVCCVCMWLRHEAIDRKWILFLTCQSAWQRPIKYSLACTWYEDIHTQAVRQQNKMKTKTPKLKLQQQLILHGHQRFVVRHILFVCLIFVRFFRALICICLSFNLICIHSICTSTSIGMHPCPDVIYCVLSRVIVNAFCFVYAI